MCDKHDISEEILVDQWFTYVTSLKDDNESAPTIDNLNDFDSHLTEKQLNDNSDSDTDDTTTIDEQPRDTTDLSRLAIFNSIKKYEYPFYKQYNTSFFYIIEHLALKKKEIKLSLTIKL